MTVYADIADFDEDKRIEIIAEQCNRGKLIMFIVEDHEKADRYVRKLQTKVRAIQEIARGEGPVAGTIFVKVAVRQ